MRLNDIGNKFGKLTVIDQYRENNKTFYKCVCDCGRETVKNSNYLRMGHTSSCGECPRTTTRRLELEGQRFGKLTAVRNTGEKNSNGSFVWEWLCDCGNTHFAGSGNIVHRNIGCCSDCRLEQLKEIGERNRTHGTPKDDKVYKAWCKIKERCFNPNDKSYPQYGAVGITMCEEWRNSFETFRNYIGRPPSEEKRVYSVDRIDNSKGYEPGNVRWATTHGQARNKGKSKANKTGHTGVQIDNKKHNGKDKLYYKACWRELNGKPKTKAFSIDTYGEELAELMAIEYREHMIEQLNRMGAGYSPNHGK